MPSKERPATFANTMADLEALADRLENNETPLEESLKDFETGVKLIRQAQKALQDAEQKVQMLINREGEPQLEPLESDEPGGDDESGQ